MKKLCAILGLLILVCSLSYCYNTNFDVSEIAYLCGYTSYNGFLSAFKSYTGKTYEKSLR